MRLVSLSGQGQDESMDLDDPLIVGGQAQGTASTQVAASYCSLIQYNTTGSTFEQWLQAGAGVYRIDGGE